MSYKIGLSNVTFLLLQQKKPTDLNRKKGTLKATKHDKHEHIASSV
jgi:hypothetical protein